MEGVKELELVDRELGLLQAGESLWLTSGRKNRGFVEILFFYHNHLLK